MCRVWAGTSEEEIRIGLDNFCVNSGQHKSEMLQFAGYHSLVKKPYFNSLLDTEYWLSPVFLCLLINARR
jgi:hypothetical protein